MKDKPITQRIWLDHLIYYRGKWHRCMFDMRLDEMVYLNSLQNNIWQGAYNSLKDNE
jgi:hypothetical protein